MAKPFDPLSYIPPAETVRRRIAQIREEARRLGVVLRTAEEIERDQQRELSENRREETNASK